MSAAAQTQLQPTQGSPSSCQMAASRAALALESNWRKVASTENLQALTDGSPEAKLAGPSQRHLLIHGGALVTAAMMLLSLQIAVLVVKALPEAAVTTPLWLAIKQDCYYCFLLPLMVPVVVLAVAFNWFSIKLFKHNS